MVNTCPLCETDVESDQDSQPISTPEGVLPAHRECLLRAVLGGIGHLVDHAHWCVAMHDPDGGVSYRESALAVDAWVERYGGAGGAESAAPVAQTIDGHSGE